MDRKRCRGEAGGRLDFLGGMATHAGALVLSKGTRVQTRVEVSPRQGQARAGFSCQSERERSPFSVEGTTLRALLALPVEQWRGRFEALGAPGWMSYVWGSFGLFVRQSRWWPAHGLHFRVASDVPRAQGVASSSALCLATLRALELSAEHETDTLTLARIAFAVEREVVGTPADLGEALACAFGTSQNVLPVLRRPDIVGKPIALPEGLMVAGCPLGAVRSAGDFAGQVARVAGDVGRAILADKWGQRSYVSEYAPSQVGDELPVALLGSDIRAHRGDEAPFGVELERVYPVRAATRFGVEENFRALVAQSLLSSNDAHQAAPLVGELLFQSHAGAANMGLSSPQSDAFVEAIRTRGPHRGFYGARVSGEGPQQTVVVLLEQSAQGELELLRGTFPMGGALIE